MSPPPDADRSDSDRHGDVRLAEAGWTDQKDRALQAARSVYEDYPFLNEHLANLRSVWHEIQSQ